MMLIFYRCRLKVCTTPYICLLTAASKIWHIHLVPCLLAIVCSKTAPKDWRHRHRLIAHSFPFFHHSSPPHGVIVVSEIPAAGATVGNHACLNCYFSVFLIVYNQFMCWIVSIRDGGSGEDGGAGSRLPRWLHSSTTPAVSPFRSSIILTVPLSLSLLVCVLPRTALGIRKSLQMEEKISPN